MAALFRVSVATLKRAEVWIGACAVSSPVLQMVHRLLPISIVRGDPAAALFESADFSITTLFRQPLCVKSIRR